MKRIFISVPMSGRERNDVNVDILETELYILKNMKHLFNDEEVLFIHNNDCKYPYYKDDQIVTKNLVYLGIAIQKLAECDAAFFVGDWRNARGCRIEHEVCKEYKITSYCFDRAGKHAIIADTFSQQLQSL